MFGALIAAVCVALISIVGVALFGHSGRLVGIERYAVPVAVGVFMSIVLYELIPETIEAAPETGGLAVAFGFISFYILANILHKKFHHLEAEDCDRKGAAMLILIGDAIHNIADGVVLGGAFLIDPTVGIATAIGLALHELPQEIVEFGILIRAGYTRSRAVFLNLLSASSIILGLILIFLVSEHAASYTWVLTGIAAGNLLFLAASDLLPRIHGNLKHYGNVWKASASIILGFIVMTIIIHTVHEYYGHAHEGEHQHTDTVEHMG